jgi:hypothetical protein
VEAERWKNNLKLLMGAGGVFWMSTSCVEGLGGLKLKFPSACGLMADVRGRKVKGRQAAGSREE